MEKQNLYVQTSPNATTYFKYEFCVESLKRGCLPEMVDLPPAKRQEMINSYEASKGDFLVLPKKHVSCQSPNEVRKTMIGLAQSIEDVLATVFEDIDPNMGCQKWSGFSKRTAGNLVKIFRQFGFDARTGSIEIPEYGIKHWYFVCARAESEAGEFLSFGYDPLRPKLDRDMSPDKKQASRQKFFGVDPSSGTLVRMNASALQWQSDLPEGPQERVQKKSYDLHFIEEDGSHNHCIVQAECMSAAVLYAEQEKRGKVYLAKERREEAKAMNLAK